MYIIKNAVKSLSRAKVRSVLICIIVLIISIAACIALSIRESAVKAREDTLEGLSVTATISYDFTSLMRETIGGGGFQKGGGFSGGGSDMLSFQNNSLTLDEYLTYTALLSSGDSYYYTLSASLDTDESFLPYNTEPGDSNTSDDNSTDDSSQQPDDPGGNFGIGGMGRYNLKGDFMLIGYSSDAALTDFINGVNTISEGMMFDTASDELECVVSENLVLWNQAYDIDISVGSYITLINPSNEEESYTLKVVGIFSGDNDSESSVFASTNSSNYIYVSYSALKTIINYSEENAVTVESTSVSGLETSSALTSELSFVYSFASTDSYYAFADGVYDMGLDDGYTVSSTDLENYEKSLEPLNELSSFAQWSLLVVFLVGAVILVVLSIFNIRDRKYEIGVLTAIGMKKSKVACQFMCELFIVTILAILIGAMIGAAVSVPVSNALLEDRIESNESTASTVSNRFGRDTDMTGRPSQNGEISMPDAANIDTNNLLNRTGGSVSYFSNVSYSTDLNVILELIGIGLLLTIVSSLTAVVSIMRYEPLKILSNRD
ncbi:MAG: ABC transporter permease [Eubacteriales bacterium]|nr:ABC transporter permease [Eubacteriales bacterium]